MNDNQNFIKQINTKNKLRNEIKEKKRTFAKLINVPEATNECIILKNEIQKLEEKLNKINI